MVSITPASADGATERADEVFDVCVYGAGMVGMVNALQYARRGLRVSIVDLPSETETIGGESLVNFANAMLRSVGDLDQELSSSFENRGLWFLHGLEGRDSFDGVTEWAEYSPLPEQWKKRVHGSALGRGMFQNVQVARSEVEAVLRGRMASRSSITVLDSASVVDVELGSDGEPHVTSWRSRDGSAGGRLSSRWVVDCTGRGRFLARRLGLSAPLDDGFVTAAVEGQFAGCTDADFPGWEYAFPEGDTARRDHTTVRLWGDGYWIGLIRLPKDRISVEVSLDRRILRDGQQLRDVFWQLLRRFPALDFLTEENCLGLTAEEDVQHISEIYVSPRRYVLAGDAASTVDPYYSQGLSEALIASWHGANIAERDITEGVLDAAYAERVNRAMQADWFLLRGIVRHKFSPAIADSRFFVLDHLLDFLVFAEVVPARYRMASWLVGTAGGDPARETPDLAETRAWLQQRGFLTCSFPFGLRGPEAVVAVLDRVRGLNERNARWRLANGVTPAPVDGVLRALAPLPATWRMPPASLLNRPVSLTPRLPKKELRPPDFEAGLPAAFRMFALLAVPFVAAAVVSDALHTGVQRLGAGLSRRRRPSGATAHSPGRLRAEARAAEDATGCGPVPPLPAG